MSRRWTFLRRVPSPTVQVQVGWLSVLFQLLRVLEGEAWVWSPAAVRAIRKLVPSDTWEHLSSQERKALLGELKDLNGRLAAIADGRAVQIETRNASLVTQFKDGDAYAQGWSLEELPTSFASIAVSYLTDA